MTNVVGDKLGRDVAPCDPRNGETLCNIARRGNVVVWIHN
jgi:hypothetical protein